MQIELLRTKIHRATVTDADVDYEGSISIDPVLLEASDILTYEAVHVWNVTRGSRLVTYAIEGERGTNEVKLNGGAALTNFPGDIIIIAAFVRFEKLVQDYVPHVVFVDSNNIVTQIRKGTLASLRKT